MVVKYLIVYNWTLWNEGSIFVCREHGKRSHRTLDCAGRQQHYVYSYSAPFSHPNRTNERTNKNVCHVGWKLNFRHNNKEQTSIAYMLHVIPVRMHTTNIQNENENVPCGGHTIHRKSIHALTKKYHILSALRHCSKISLFFPPESHHVM